MLLLLFLPYDETRARTYVAGDFNALGNHGHPDDQTL